MCTADVAWKKKVTPTTYRRLQKSFVDILNRKTRDRAYHQRVEKDDVSTWNLNIKLRLKKPEASPEANEKLEKKTFHVRQSTIDSFDLCCQTKLKIEKYDASFKVVLCLRPVWKGFCRVDHIHFTTQKLILLIRDMYAILNCGRP